jgi:DNA-binding ferritin-like protein (Dps family)
VTGAAVTAFCDELIREWRGPTGQDKVRQKFNDRIRQRLDEAGDDRA